MNDDDTFIYLNENHSKEKEIIEIFESANYYTIPNFKFLLNHLKNNGILHEIIIDIFCNIEEKKKNNEWKALMSDIFFSSYYDYFPEEIIIKRCSDGTFTTQGELNNAIEEDDGYSYLNLYDNYPSQTKVYHENVACIWPFSEGYARVIGKDGRWGFLSQEDNVIRWIDHNIMHICDLNGNITGIDMDGSVLYADNFKCERARVQLDDEKKSYMFLGLCLDDCFGKTFNYASEFENGYAKVSDYYCDYYTINVFGEIIDADKNRYEECMLRVLEEGKGEFAKRRRRRLGYYDPETEIMRSLSGHGADPELYGF